jgi:hypothetical protein
MIRALKDGEFPVPAMLTFHPQRWAEKVGPWLRELVWQNMKNGVKRKMVRK